MNRQKIAQELMTIARELTGATKDLAEIRAVLPELRDKQVEYERKQEEQRREMNRMWGEATRELGTKTKELLEAIQKELEGYFGGNGMGGVRKSDLSHTGQLLEVFIGSDDGVERYQSKVSVQIAMTFKGRETYSYMLRNEELDDQKGDLADRATIAKLMQVVKRADKQGFWAESEGD